MDANLASLWDAFNTLVLDQVHAGDLQRKESRRAFYAGAGAMFQLVMKATEPEDEQVCELLLSEIEHELNHFAELLKAGKA